VNRAGAALRDAAAKFSAGQPDMFTDHPQQRGIGFYVDAMRTTIDVQLGHDFSSTGFGIFDAMYVCNAAANLLAAGTTLAVLRLRWAAFAHAVRQIMLAPGNGQLKTAAC
jgi:hypothetical protein